MFISDFAGSPSLEVVNLVLQKLARGEKVTSLAIGEPMYKTPDKIIEVAYQSMKDGDTHYTSSYGIREVRDAIVEKVGKKNNITASIDNSIFITSKQSIYSSFMALAGKKKKILIPNPGYFYSEPAMLAGLSPVYYNLKKDLSFDTEDIAGKIDHDTAAIVLNSPGNPTGRIVDRGDLETVYEKCKRSGVHIISDEAYEDLVYEKKHFSVGSLEDSPELVITIFSLSKSYSMTGWRAGYTIASPGIVSNIARVLEHTYTCSPPFIQKASAYALQNGEKFVDEFRRDFKKKRDHVKSRLDHMQTLSQGPIEGAFYAFPSYSKKINSAEFSKELLERHGTAVIPGSAFGPSGEGHIRISFGGSMETIDKGLDELEKYLSS
ncbi:MAG: pyridoxal phosphate-dependent aminotransferase [Thermoplasmata archaeon]